MDVTTLSNEDLAALINAAEAERQSRNRETRLKDAAWSLVMDAKAAGYTKAAVAQYLTQIVNQGYGT